MHLKFYDKVGKGLKGSYNKFQVLVTGGSKGGQSGHGPPKSLNGGQHVFWPPKTS